MSIGWMADDIAEWTGKVIGAPDFPTLIYRAPSAYERRQFRTQAFSSSSKLEKVFSLLEFEKSEQKKQQTFIELAKESSSRIADCLACEEQIIRISLASEITSITLHTVLGEIQQYLNESKDSFYLLQGKLRHHGIQIPNVDEFIPEKSDVRSAMKDMIYKFTLYYLLTTNAVADAFWRIEDDLKHINNILGLDSFSALEYLSKAGNLKNSYIKCQNCGRNYLETNTGKIFPFCFQCYEKRGNLND